jgi:hypothetical protein
MAVQDSARTEENPDINLKEVQREIALDAAANDCRADSATEKESRTVEINPPPTWGGLISADEFDGQFCGFRIADHSSRAAAKKPRYS